MDGFGGLYELAKLEESKMSLGHPCCGSLFTDFHKPDCKNFQQKVFYFGCVNEAGHYMWDTTLRNVDKFSFSNPWGTKVDGGLLDKKAAQVQGTATIHQKDGWTALSFWDRSVDSRQGSCSTYLAYGELTFEQMFMLCKMCFPTIWERYKFEVVDATLVDKAKEIIHGKV